MLCEVGLDLVGFRVFFDCENKDFFGTGLDLLTIGHDYRFSLVKLGSIILLQPAPLLPRDLPSRLFSELHFKIE